MDMNLSNSMDMNLSKIQELVEDKGAWCITAHSGRVGHDLVIEQQQILIRYLSFNNSLPHGLIGE